MHQLLHMLVVNRHRHAALVQRCGRRWMFPVVACREHARAPIAAREWWTGRGLEVTIVGQWLGQVACDARAIDWLVVGVTANPVQPAPEGLAWVDTGDIEPRMSATNYQEHALRTILERDIGVPGPFGSIDWLDEAIDWTSARSRRRISGHPVCYRAAPYEVVLGMATTTRAQYLKGVASDHAADVSATCAMSVLHPRSFPQVLACDTRADGSVWLLMEACDGVPLARHPCCEAAVRVAADIGRLQRQTPTTIAAPTVDVHELYRAAVQLLERANASIALEPLRRAVDVVASLETGWTPLDLDPVNVFVGRHSIEYIDLDACLAAMPLGVAVLCRRSRKRAEPADVGLIDAMRAAYECAWGRRVPWPEVDCVSALGEVVRGWERLMLNVEAGVVSGPVDRLAAIAAGKLSVRACSARA